MKRNRSKPTWESPPAEVRMYLLERVRHLGDMADKILVALIEGKVDSKAYMAATRAVDVGIKAYMREADILGWKPPKEAKEHQDTKEANEVLDDILAKRRESN